MKNTNVENMVEAFEGRNYVLTNSLANRIILSEPKKFDEFVAWYYRSQVSYYNRKYKEAHLAIKKSEEILGNLSQNDLQKGGVSEPYELVIHIINFNLGLILTKLGRYDEAITVLEILSKQERLLSNYMHLVHFHLGYLYGLSGFYSTSMSHFESTLREYTNQVSNSNYKNFVIEDVYRQYLFSYFKKSNKYYYNTLGKEPHLGFTREAYLNRIRCMVEILCNEKESIKSFPQFFNTYSYILNYFEEYNDSIEITNIILGNENGKNGMPNLTKIILDSHLPENPGTMRNQCFAYFSKPKIDNISKQDNDKALWNIDLAIDMEPLNPNSWNYKGTILLNMALNVDLNIVYTDWRFSKVLMEEAVRCFNRSIELFRNRGIINSLRDHSYLPINNKGVALLYLKKTEDAIVCFDDAVKSFNRFHEVRYDIQKTINTNGKINQDDTIPSIDDINIIKIFSSAHNNLAYSKSKLIRESNMESLKEEIKDHLNKAIESLEFRQKLDPHVTLLKTVLSSAHFNYGRLHAITGGEAKDSLEEFRKSHDVFKDYFKDIITIQNADLQIRVTNANILRHMGFMSGKVYHQNQDLQYFDKTFNRFKEASLTMRHLNQQQGQSITDFAYILNTFGYNILYYLNQFQNMVVTQEKIDLLRRLEKNCQEILDTYEDTKNQFYNGLQNDNSIFATNIRSLLDILNTTMPDDNLSDDISILQRLNNNILRQSLILFYYSKSIDVTFAHPYYNLGYLVFKVITMLNQRKEYQDKTRQNLIDLSLYFFKEAIRKKPDFTYAWYNIAVSHLENKNYSKCLDSISKALNLYNQSPHEIKEKGDILTMYLLQGNMLANHGRHSEAIEVYKEGIELFCQSIDEDKVCPVIHQIKFSMGLSYLLTQDFKNSINIFEDILNFKCLKTKPDPYYLNFSRLFLSMALFESGDYFGALDKIPDGFEHANSKGDTLLRSSYYLIRAMCRHKLGSEEANEDYLSAEMSDNKLLAARAYYNHGLLLVRNERPMEGKEMFLEAIKRDPNFVAATRAYESITSSYDTIELGKAVSIGMQRESKSITSKIKEAFRPARLKYYKRKSNPFSGLASISTAFVYIITGLLILFIVDGILSSNGNLTVDNQLVQNVVYLIIVLIVLRVFPYAIDRFTKVKITVQGIEMERPSQIYNSLVLERLTIDLFATVKLLTTNAPINIPFEIYRTPIQRVAVPMRSPLSNLDMPSPYSHNHELMTLTFH